MSRRERRRRPRRGMHLLPSLLTVGNIYCGYVSIMRAMMGEYESAAVFILVAALLDALDGRVARLTGTSSEFGLQLDSIADVISFGVAPALAAFSWSLNSYGRLGWAVSFLFVICGAMRLARFNIQRTVPDRRFFVGMPIPAAAFIIATIIFVHPEPPSEAGEPLLGGMLLTLVLLLSLLMVSKMRYRSFKDLDLRARRSPRYLLIPAAALALIALHPQIMLMLGAFAYLISGIVPRIAFGRPEATEGLDRPLAAGQDSDDGR